VTPAEVAAALPPLTDEQAERIGRLLALVASREGGGDR